MRGRRRRGDEGGSHALWVGESLGGRGVGGGEVGGVELLLQAARGAERAGGGRESRGSSCQCSFLAAARPPRLASCRITGARGMSAAARGARGLGWSLRRYLRWWLGAAVLASRSTTFPCPGWSPWARLGWRAQPQVELGPCLEVRGVEVQGGLPPSGPVAVEGGQQVEDLLLVLVGVVHRGGGGGGGHGGEAVTSGPAILAGPLCIWSSCRQSPASSFRGRKKLYIIIYIYYEMRRHCTNPGAIREVHTFFPIDPLEAL